MRMRALSLALAMSLFVAPSSAEASVAHVIAPGESLSSIAAADGLTVQQLADANGLSPNAELIAGATIAIPPQASPSASAAPSQAGSSARAAPSRGGGGTYLVRPGDTLSAIAASEGVSVERLAAANGLDPSGVLLSGSVLRIPGSGAAGSRAAPSSGGGDGGGPPYATDEQVSGSEIAQIASANGVPASLAEAIAWQESGFDNDVVSDANARGVMQIIPSTWSWIGHHLAPQPPLASASALDNVRGGVLLLRSLLAATGSPALAVAAYYEGLDALRRFGMLEGTQQYVNDVLALAQHFGGS